MLQHKFDGVCLFGRKDGNRGVACHPDGEFGHEEMRTIFRKNGDFCRAWQSSRLQMRRHTPSLVQGLCPCVIDHLSVAHRLGHEYFIGMVFFMRVNFFKNQDIRVVHAVLFRWRCRGFGVTACFFSSIIRIQKVWLSPCDKRLIGRGQSVYHASHRYFLVFVSTCEIPHSPCSALGMFFFGVTSVCRQLFFG